MDNNRNKGDNLSGNLMLWTLNHWTRVLVPCAWKDRDFMFKKESVKIRRAEEFIFAPLFKNPRSSTNGWQTAEYKNLKRQGIALGVMHICDHNAQPMSPHGRKKSDRRPTKRRKVADDSGIGRRPESRMAKA
ncbi:hypothetical protein AXG93_4265s1020 [Marchantia polymorpha subsp. ruderalis]|uniref:Uncharacterized protein n=1 Tax=Marchantia polymorpha subsp. ruderalis TaxID=1480154 RepID=A0A176VVC2_MARPO|nr:hypothetical protein AXG93_4265s1020 [Marchantia polymorpha subsp. ruderalis]